MAYTSQTIMPSRVCSTAVPVPGSSSVPMEAPSASNKEALRQRASNWLDALHTHDVISVKGRGGGQEEDRTEQTSCLAPCVAAAS